MRDSHDNPGPAVASHRVEAMIVAFWCVLVAGVMPLSCAYFAKFGPAETSDRFDNRTPREWLGRQTGFRARANAAQANGFEAFPLFAAGVIVCVLQHVPVPTIDLLAVVFVVSRVFFIVFYLTDRATLRSFAWLVGFLATVGLFLTATTGTLR